MKITVHHTCKNFTSYRAERVKSLFNCEDGYRFDLEAEIPVDDDGWKLGLIVGPSGSGKTSMGRALFGDNAVYRSAGWSRTKPIIDEISPERMSSHRLSIARSPASAQMRFSSLIGHRFRPDSPCWRVKK